MLMVVDELEALGELAGYAPCANPPYMGCAYAIP